MSGKISKALGFAALYALIAGLWIFGTERLLEGRVTDVLQFSDLQIVKGIGFVSVTALALFGLMHRYTRRLALQTQRLADSERQYRLLFQTNPQPMWVYDLDTLAFLAVNEAAVIHYGYSREEFLALTIRDIRPAGERPRLASYVDGIGNGLRHSEGWHHRRKDGSLIEVDIVSHPTPFDGRSARLVLVRDVTEQRRAEEALRESEALNRAVLDSILAQVAVLDRAGNILAVNESWRRFGRDESGGARPAPEDAFVGANYLDICRAAEGEHGETAIAVHDGLEAVLHGRTDRFALEYPCDLPGRVYWFSMSVTPLSGARGGAVVAHSDISERKEAELRNLELTRALERHNAELDAERAHWRAVIEGVADEVWSCDAGGRISLANLAEMTAMGLEEFRDRPVEAILLDLEILEPDGRPRPPERAPLLRSLRGEAVRGEEIMVHRPSGRRRNRQYSAAPIRDATGAITGAVGIVLDITDLRRVEQALRDSEARFSTAFRASPVGIGISRLTDGRFIDINDTLLHLMGRGREEVIGHAASELDLWARPPDRAALVGMLRGRGPVRNFETQFRRKSGEILDVLISAELIELGPETHFLGMVLDITDRKRAEAERELLQKQLQQAQKMEAIGQLTGGIAHDFNNILASILGYTALALDRYAPDPDSKLAEYLRQVQTAGERARDLVSKMLVFSKSGPSRELRPLAPQILVGEVAQMLASAIPSSIELVTRCGETPPILIDPVDLHQVITNLVINARDAIDGGGRVEIGLRRGRQVDLACDACHQRVRGEFVELSVEDTGRGIPADVLPRIFDPFFSTKGVGRGSGMGLSVVLGLVHGAGGHILVRSRPGKTGFRILFPPAVARPEEAAAPAVRAPEPQNLLQVLVVDDEPAVAGLLGEWLEGRGCRASVFTDSREALARFTAAPDDFDLVITDQTMPGLAGAELAEAMLRLRGDLTIVLCTGYSERIDAAQAARLGIRHYFQKPVRLNELLAVLVELEQAGKRQKKPSRTAFPGI